MISIKAVSLNGQPLTPPLSATFDERGGTIGRKDDSTLVLADPERLISRHHAIIEYRGGSYIVKDQGTGTPVYLNRQALGNGREARIKAGDELRIGGYVMQVDAPQIQTAMHTAKSSPQQASILDDPFAAFAIKPVTNTPLESGADITSGTTSKPFIPSDFDPFSDLKPKNNSNTEQQPLSELGSGLGISTSNENQSIDALFGLSGASTHNDPFGINASITGKHEKSSLPTDPLAAMGFAAQPKADTSHIQRNDTPELKSSFKLPEFKLDSMLQPQTTPQVDVDASLFSTGGHNQVIPENTRGIKLEPEGHHTIFNTPIKETSGAIPKDDPLTLLGATNEEAGGESPCMQELFGVGEQLVTEPKQHIKAESKTNEAQTGAPAAQWSNQAMGDAALLQAFLAGIGTPDLEIEGGLTPEFMNLIGKLMREMTQGTLDLLLARSLTKREVRAEMTMIEVRENNPLKFSPNVEVALSHLFTTQMRGFLPPVKAVKGAFDDLRSHQLGFMAGIQGALAGVLQRFNPEQLEKRLTQKSVIDSLLPMNRRAKLWDLFNDLYEDISKEAEDDFHALFGKEFLKAYEAQIAKLEGEGK